MNFSQLISKGALAGGYYQHIIFLISIKSCKQRLGSVGGYEFIKGHVVQPNILYTECPTKNAQLNIDNLDLIGLVSFYWMYKLNKAVLTNQAKRHLCNIFLYILNTTQGHEKNNNYLVFDRTETSTSVPSNVSSFKLIHCLFEKKSISVQQVQPNLGAHFEENESIQI